MAILRSIVRARAKLWGLTLLIGSSACWAATYYVDARNGDDGNPGLSPRQAWKTLAKVNASHFQPGDSVLLRRGMTWRAQLCVPDSGAPGKPIIFGAYGNGAPPVLNAADVQTGWSLHAGAVYKKPWPFIDVVAVEDGIRLDKGKGPDELACGQFYTDRKHLYIRCTDDQNPDNHTIEVATRPLCIDPNGKSHIVIDGLALKYAKDHCIRFRGATDWTLRNNVFCAPRASHLMFIEPNNAPLTIRNNKLLEAGQEAIYFDISSITHGEVVLDQNTFADSGWFCIPGRTEGDAIDIKRDNTAAVRITNNHICWDKNKQYPSHVSYGIVTNTGSAFQAFGNTIIDPLTVGIQVAGEGSVVSRNTIIHTRRFGIRTHELKGIVVYANDVRVSHNLIVGVGRNPNPYSGIHLGYRESGNRHGLTICNNTIYGWDNGIFFGGGTNKLTDVCIKNNIIAEYIRFGIAISCTPISVEIDHNLFHSSWHGSGVARWNGTNAVTLEAWQKLCGQDRHSIAAEPQFQDPSRYDFRLRRSSPCIDSGASVPLLQDLSGSNIPQGEAFDLGAIEYTPG